MKFTLFLLVGVISLLTGCPMKTKPSTNFSENQLVTQTNNYLGNQQMAYYCAISEKKVTYDYTNLKYSCTDTTDASRNKEVAKRIRNEAIENGIMAVNGVYTNFVDDLNKGRATGNFIADIIDLGTSATIGVTKGERPLQVLGVALTAFRGGRKSAELNFFREQSTPILINKMDDNRSIQYAIILQKKDKSVDEYPMAEAIRDIVDYYNAGTLIRAFTQLSKDTGEKANQSEKRVLKLQKIDVEDVVDIPEDVKEASLMYIKYRRNFSKILSTGSANDKAEASEKLRLIYLDISKDSDFKSFLEKVKNDNPGLKVEMDRLEDSDESKSKQVKGETIINILSEIYSTLNLKTDDKLIVKFKKFFDKHF